MRIFVLILTLVSTSTTQNHPDPLILEKLEEEGLNVTELIEIREQLDEVKDQAEAEIILTPEQEAELQEKLKDVDNITQDKTEDGGEAIEDANDETGVSQILYQGDIVLTKPQAAEIVEEIKHSGTEGTEDTQDVRKKRQAYRDKWYPITVWSKGVNYYFQPSATHGTRSIFLKAMELWRSQTCIEFYENPYAEDRIGVFKGVGCWSHIGRTGTEQSLSLGERCENLRNAAHEIGHSLGLFHTQSRHDRDSYITFNAHNVQHGWVSEYNKETEETNYNYGLAYDYGSIMHYGAHSSSRNTLPTMIPRDTKYLETLGSAIISFNDLYMINKHYNCTAKCDPSKSAKCKRGGYPHPRNCAKCICPGGYGGDLCDKRPDDGCGKVLQATSSYRYFQAEVGDRQAGRKARVDFTTCTYWIKASKGSRVEVNIKELDVGHVGDGCQFGGVEIKSQQDQRLTGYRYCAPKDNTVTLVSTHNIVPVIIFNRFYVTKVTIQYREIPGGQVNPTTRRPKPPATTVRPKPSECVDSERCKLLMQLRDFCRRPTISTPFKRAHCGKSCNLC